MPDSRLALWSSEGLGIGIPGRARLGVESVWPQAFPLQFNFFPACLLLLRNFLKMSGSIIAENSAGAASKAKEVTFPVYADDLTNNVRAGFDNTCVYIKDCTDALEERLNSKLEAITNRLDALTDNLINPLVREEPHPTAPLWDVPPQRDGHVDVLARRPVSPVHGGVAADFEDDVGYVP
jgi:hypothetical protein